MGCNNMPAIVSGSAQLRCRARIGRNNVQPIPHEKSRIHSGLFSLTRPHEKRAAFFM
jgi:hypothetical protein